MHSTSESSCGLKILPQEWLFCFAVAFGWAIMVATLGKDVAWDFRNYHWYVPYAFLNGRMGIDIAVAHQATYYNPFLDLPFYLLATHLHAWMALGVLGFVQGANIAPLYVIARSILLVEHRRLAAGIISFLCMTGSLTIHLAGTTYYDNVMSVFVLSGLALVISRRRELNSGTLMQGVAIAGIAGFLIGSAIGLKLPEAPYALGLAASLVMLPGDFRHRTTRLCAVAAAGAIGVAAFAGFWMVKMAHLTGNPLFPYFNEYFRSPLALHASYRDMRFIPRRLDIQLLFPLLFSIDWRVADDLPFQDIRVGVAYIVILATLIMRLVGQQPAKPIVDRNASFALIGFAAISYIAWLKIFAIYRYILLLEMLSPLLIVASIMLWPVSQRTRVALASTLILLSLATMKVSIDGRMPTTDPYVQVTLPPISHPSKTMVLMTGIEPMGYLAPSFPKAIPIVRIDGWMIQPSDGSQLTQEARKRVGAFHGDLFVLFKGSEAARSREALLAYGLARAPGGCRNIVSNLGGPYEFCPVIRTQSPVT
jgi:hypothetical protein